MVHVCAECGRPAKFQLQTYDGQDIYLCENHVEGWYVAKIREIKSSRSKPKSSESPPKKEQER